MSLGVEVFGVRAVVRASLTVSLMGRRDAKKALEICKRERPDLSDQFDKHINQLLIDLGREPLK